MWYRYLLFAALILVFVTTSSAQSTNATSTDATSTFPPFTPPHFQILVAVPPPRDFILGVLLVVALNIEGQPSPRLSSVVAQELVNPEIDGVSAYFLILNEYSVLEVSEQLEQVANTTELQIEDLQILINASTCTQPTRNLTSSQIALVVFRLERLYRERSNITLNLGCNLQENTTASDEATNSTTVSLNGTDTTASERKSHGFARHRPEYLPDKTRHQKGIHGVSSRDHGESHQQANARDHHLHYHNHHLHVRNHHKERNTHRQHEVAHDRSKERNANLEPQ